MSSIPIVGFGTYKISGYKYVSDSLNQALRAGYRLFDTATVYRNEEDIGKALKVLLPENGLDRQDVFITSKLAPKDHGLKNCREACLRSLSKLDTGFIDLYLIHWPGVQKTKPTDVKNAKMRAESWRALEELHREGKVKNIGVSNYTKRHLEELLSFCDIKPALLQIEHHPHLIQQELIDFCKSQDIIFQAYSSLGTTSEDNQLLTNEVVQSIAKKRQLSSAQILLRWAVQQDVYVIPKSTNPVHIHNNFDIFGFELDEQEIQQLNSLNCDKHYCWDPQNIK